MTVLGNVGTFGRIACRTGGDGGNCQEYCDSEDAGDTGSGGDDDCRVIETARESETNTLTW